MSVNPETEDESRALELYKNSGLQITAARAPADVLTEAIEAAKCLQEVIVKGQRKPVTIRGKLYPTFEQWQLIAHFYGISAKPRDTRYVEYGAAKGWEASADAVMVATGQVVSSADAMCMDDEEEWATKPMFQIRSMCQTRAAAKCLRNIFSFIMVLAGYEPTPAEEMTGREHTGSPPPTQDRSSQSTPKPGGDKPISEPQAKRFYAIVYKSKIPNEVVEAALQKRGYTSAYEIKKGDYEALCNWAEGYRKQREEEPPPPPSYEEDEYR